MTFAAAIAAVVVLAPCPSNAETLGCAVYDQQTGAATIYVFSHPSYRRGVLAHEQGHVFDFRALDDAKRQWIARRMEWRDWRPEAFADQFAACQMRHHTIPPGLWLGKPVRKVCRFIRGGALTN